MARALLMLTLVVLALALGVAAERYGDLTRHLAQRLQDTPAAHWLAGHPASVADGETALEHALKHLDPTYVCPMHPQVTSDKPGRCPICGMDLVLREAPAAAERRVLYWYDPMHPEVRFDAPGRSPFMAMDLVPKYADEASPGDGPPLVTVAPEVIQSLGVRTSPVERAPMSRPIETVGFLGYDEARIGHVHVRTEGWIERLAVSSVGDRVAPGQHLFDLYSPTLVNAQQEFLQALATGNARLVQASRDRLRALGVADSQVRKLEQTREVEQRVRIFAHHGGVVSELLVREGMYIEPATEVMTLVDLASVWLLAEVFERQASWVEVGQRAEARVPAMPGRVWQGRVDYIYPDLDPQTRTLRVRLRFDNPDGALKPNMFAQVAVAADPRPAVLQVPREAVIRDGRSARVVVALGEGRFQARPVVLGIESGDQVEILDGLEEGETVVTSAQFLIDSEASLQAGLQRMEPIQAAPTSDLLQGTGGEGEDGAPAQDGGNGAGHGMDHEAGHEAEHGAGHEASHGGKSGAAAAAVPGLALGPPSGESGARAGGGAGEAGR